MALKTHPEVITYKYEADGTSISYDKTKRNRSDQVGLAIKSTLNSGKAELADADDTLGGVVESIDDDNICTVAIGGVVLFKKGHSTGTTLETVAVGDRLIGAVRGTAKGYVKAVSAIGASYAQTAAQRSIRSKWTVIAENDEDVLAIRG